MIQIFGKCTASFKSFYKFIYVPLLFVPSVITISIHLMFSLVVSQMLIGVKIDRQSMHTSGVFGGRFNGASPTS